MNRRQFLGGIAGTLLFPGSSLAQGDEATPAVTPEHSGRPRPHVLGDGIELVDYRIYPSSDVRRVIGEIWNTRDDMVDSPVVSMTFPDVDEPGGFAYAPPSTPVLKPGESTMVFGVIPDEIDSDELLASASFGLCDPAAPGEFSELYARFHLEAIAEETYFRDHYLNVQGKIYNRSETRALYTKVSGLVRDQNGRYTGATSSSNPGHVVAKGNKPFAIHAGEGVNLLADPFRLLIDSQPYSVELKAGFVVQVTAPRCTAGYPGS